MSKRKPKFPKPQIQRSPTGHSGVTLSEAFPINWPGTTHQRLVIDITHKVPPTARTFEIDIMQRGVTIGRINMSR